MTSFKEYLKGAFAEIDLDTAVADKPTLTTSYDIHTEIQSLFISTRTEIGLTQKELSELSSVPQANISRFENGKTHPSIDVLKKLADAMQKRLVITLIDAEVE